MEPTVAQPVRDAQAYLAEHDRDVSWLKPSELAREVEQLRQQLNAVLAVLGEPQAPGPVYPDRPMDTDDIDPATGECWEDGEH
jgi:hypothetical protein